MPRSFSRLAAVLLALAASLPARSQDKDTQYDDARNPHYKAAQQDLDNNNATAAASEYEAALAANPELVEAHYQLGLIYAEKLQDPVSSIYHFRHYLAIAPNANHSVNAKDMIAKEERIFAASVPVDPGGEDPATLKTENAALKKEVADAKDTIAKLQSDLARASATPAAPTAAGAPQAAAPEVAGETNPAPAGPMKALPLDAPNPAIATGTATPGAAGADASGYAGPTTTYVVKGGDTIDRIAHRLKIHGEAIADLKQQIMDMNHITDPHKLQIGQKLTVPAPSAPAAAAAKPAAQP